MLANVITIPSDSHTFVECAIPTTTYLFQLSSSASSSVHFHAFALKTFDILFEPMFIGFIHILLSLRRHSNFLVVPWINRLIGLGKHGEMFILTRQHTGTDTGTRLKCNTNGCMGCFDAEEKEWQRLRECGDGGWLNETTRLSIIIEREK